MLSVNQRSGKNNMETQQRVALVTGAAGGVGQSTVEKLAAEGCIVIGTDIRAIEETPPEGVVYRQHDVTSEADWQSLAAWLEEEYGHLDILVNNAAILMAYHIEDQSLEDFNTIMQVNCTSIFLGMKILLPVMKKSAAASIVNM